jgi:hypothetical protein
LGKGFLIGMSLAPNHGFAGREFILGRPGDSVPVVFVFLNATFHADRGYSTLKEKPKRRLRSKRNALVDK